MPLVLVHNDVVANPAHQWDDVEGVHYHYPSKYRGKIQSGERFVYYRGVHRANGGRGPAEYVGSGLIGKIWADPARKNAWYCGVEEYERFSSPVPAKVAGVNREKIPSNLWRDGVRVLDPQVFEEIIKAASTGASALHPITADEAGLPEPANLILPADLANKQPLGNPYRRSRRSKEIGDWAEKAAFAYIKNEVAGCTACTHRAAVGETPGWDIDYRDAKGLLQRVEVKGTIAAAFASIDLTANEMKAAKEHAAQYWLCLVAECETKQPKIQLIQNPARRIASGEWAASATAYAVRFNAA